MIEGKGRREKGRLESRWKLYHHPVLNVGRGGWVGVTVNGTDTGQPRGDGAR